MNKVATTQKVSKTTKNSIDRLFRKMDETNVFFLDYFDEEDADVINNTISEKEIAIAELRIERLKLTRQLTIFAAKYLDFDIKRGVNSLSRLLSRLKNFNPKDGKLILKNIQDIITDDFDAEMKYTLYSEKPEKQEAYIKIANQTVNKLFKQFYTNLEREIELT